MKFVVKSLHDSYSPNTTIIPALGNHDSFPNDYFIDYHSGQNSSTVEDFYERYIVKGALGDIFPNGYHEQQDEFGKQCGFYVIRDKKLYENESDDGNGTTQTFIVLNTNLYYTNKAPKLDFDDPCSQLKNLKKALEDSKDDENIFIVGHVPPGFFELHPGEPFFTDENITRKFLQIVTDKVHADKIVAHFYGHTHTISYRIFMDQNDNSTPRGVAFIAPSITPMVSMDNILLQNLLTPFIYIYIYGSDCYIIVFCILINRCHLMELIQVFEFTITMWWARK